MRVNLQKMGRKRDFGRKYPSGAEKQRQKILKQEKEAKVLAKTPKLNIFFENNNNNVNRLCK